jgi:hypothetical protein
MPTVRASFVHLATLITAPSVQSLDTVINYGGATFPKFAVSRAELESKGVLFSQIPFNEQHYSADREKLNSMSTI